jgi:hypothetical protein
MNDRAKVPPPQKNILRGWHSMVEDLSVQMSTSPCYQWENRHPPYMLAPLRSSNEALGIGLGQAIRIRIDAHIKSYRY